MIEMNERKIWIMLVLLLIMQSTHSYFFDLNAFSGEAGVSSGTIIRTQAGVQNSYYFNSNQETATTSRRNLQQSTNRFEHYFGKQNTRNYVYNTPGIIGWAGNPAFQQQASNHPDMRGVRNMYLSIGIPRDVIEVYYIPQLKMILQWVDMQFSKGVHPLYESAFFQNMYTNLKRVKQSTDRLVNTYMSDVKTIIYGSNNRVMGQKLFISTDNMIVNANNAFIYNGGGTNNRVSGQNIMRTKRYEFNFDELDAILKRQITRCIKIVS